MHVLATSLLFGAIAGVLAFNKARNALGWFLAGCVVGPFAMVVALLPMALKPGMTVKCPACSETVRSEAQVCRYCHTDLRWNKFA